MAGSFDSCDDNGKYRFDFIENMGDADEACEMMHYMIRWLTRRRPERLKQAKEAYYSALSSNGFFAAPLVKTKDSTDEQ